MAFGGADDAPDLGGGAFDLIVVGTDLPAAVLAAAAARAGKRVLQLDRNGFYGGHTATVDVSQLCDVLAAAQAPAPAPGGADGADAAGAGEDAADNGVVQLEPAAVLPGVGAEAAGVRVFVRGVAAAAGSDAAAVFAASPAAQEAVRRVTVDAAARLFFATGPLLDVLVRSTVARYLDFKTVDTSFLWHDGAARLVPGSRADMFRNRYVGLKEKRILAKFLALVREHGVSMARKEARQARQQAKLERAARGSGGGDDDDDASSASSSSSGEDEDDEDEAAAAAGGASASAAAATAAAAALDVDSEAAAMAGSFDTFLTEQHLTPKLRDFVAYAIALRRELADVTLRDGMRELNRYVGSLGRFDTHTPFIALMYGLGEMVQGFARLGAVFGAIYLLRAGLNSIRPAPEPLKPERQEDNDKRTTTIDDDLDAAAEPCDGGDNAVRVVDCWGRPLTARCVAFAAQAAPRQWTRVVRSTAHGAVLCRQPAIHSTAAAEGQGADTATNNGNALLVLPPGAVAAAADGSHPANASAIHVVQIGGEMGTSPEGTYTLHLSLTSDDPDADPDALTATLHSATRMLFPVPEQQQQQAEEVDAVDGLVAEQVAPAPAAAADNGVDFEAYWVNRERAAAEADRIGNACVVLDDIDSAEMQLEKAVADARRVFNTLYPGTDFLPPAPSADDIVWEEQPAPVEAKEEDGESPSHDDNGEDDAVAATTTTTTTTTAAETETPAAPEVAKDKGGDE